MSNQKSIIGCGYIPLEMQAVCLKTNMNTNLGDIVYKILRLLMNVYLFARIFLI